MNMMNMNNSLLFMFMFVFNSFFFKKIKYNDYLMKLMFIKIYEFKKKHFIS